jgi:putative protease
MELAAPAGDQECFYAAVENGADAVYLGLPKYNARLRAANFTLAELPKYIAFAHERGVKIYVALNTLIAQSDLSDAVKTALAAADAGADALILQDMGLARELRRERGGDIVLHASTQAGIHNVAGARFARAAGFTRAVLSRETPLCDIAQIKANADIEIEVFVQGALCVSFSGNCYFSALVSGCGGNNGMCLQLCRKDYTALVDGERAETGALLSAADLCLLRELPRLARAGVDSIKIEGRLRRAEYAACAVREYRAALDTIARNGGEYPAGTDLAAPTDRLKAAYNRGDYTAGYLYGADERLIYSQHQGHKGLYIGDVCAVSGRYITVRARVPLHAGDGFKLFRGGAETGGAVCIGGNRLRGGGGIRVGDKVHLTSSGKKGKGGAVSFGGGGDKA